LTAAAQPEADPSLRQVRQGHPVHSQRRCGERDWARRVLAAQLRRKTDHFDARLSGNRQVRHRDPATRPVRAWGVSQIARSVGMIDETKEKKWKMKKREGGGVVVWWGGCFFRWLHVCGRLRHHPVLTWFFALLCHRAPRMLLSPFMSSWPGPNKYSLPSSIQKQASSKLRNAPASSLSGRTKFGSIFG